ncbi:Allergen Fus c 3 [Fusarium odoratissimum]|uniref:Allergen Fus c 3 n=1 Tax=Fusarium oxysporum f. sp. cubense (strain race 4) TaxID=2502994 RepID=N1S2C8_FUSC4|nr:Allergen Fus c 3 [Fusarium odoratissimum]
MAGDHNEDQSFYDFLIEEPERRRHPVISHINSPFRRRIEPAAMRRRGQNRPKSRPTTTRIQTQIITRVRHIPPASSGPMSMDWSMYHVPPNLQLNHPQFDFEIPGHMGVVGHSNHLSHAPTDPASFSYGSNLVSPSSIHPNSAHFDTGVPSQWDDSMSHDASTPKVRTPVHHVASNPWAEIDEPTGDNNATPASRPRKTPRPRRQKKEARKLSDASQGAMSSSTGGTAPSISDAASPSSASQNSRASIGSKSVSMASTASTTSSRQSKLRSASRTSKTTVQYRPSWTGIGPSIF